MPRFSIAGSFLLQAVMIAWPMGSALAQHDHGSRQPGLRLGAQGVGVLTHATPAMLNENLTEAYLTQPAIMADGGFWGGRISFSGVLNLEGLTLDRGELNHGVWGEGYVDRRHPHTYLHEAMVMLQGTPLGFDASLSAGKGFAPFGTDDPMVRPFVKYPANHHLAQILERIVAIAAVRRGPVLAELGLFNGDEPTRPKDIGSFDRFGDSWSARGTVIPVTGLELQASYAELESPEQPRGNGLDQKKRSVSARVDVPISGSHVYALVEHAHTRELNNGETVFVFTSSLVEAKAEIGGWSLSGRFERTSRPDEERTHDLFRSIRPATDNSILGTWRWRLWTAAAAKRVNVGAARITPFVEVSRAHAQSTDAFPFTTPADLYGKDRIWNLSAGVRLGAGMRHERMGRYGAASN